MLYRHRLRHVVVIMWTYSVQNLYVIMIIYVNEYYGDFKYIFDSARHGNITFIISSKILYIHAIYACLNSEISRTKEK